MNVFFAIISLRLLKCFVLKNDDIKPLIMTIDDPFRAETNKHEVRYCDFQ